ncbi:flagellar biosynthesis protein FlhB [Alkalibacterium olivapovliticus]|uniref:Flagellar biosynthetic protein FlhB n=1 Tax=Alkalibacterium olivapovliticus TaxID=99907 RepID=A0A2T0VYR4_9LACT|nr:flagellar biosynthesis protein FlhB [Alkalibacterium olivapovliticus]PRY77517.1 flagellar biosynthetic protein FlhB [Alkalibacterium olivapovliticus]
MPADKDGKTEKPTPKKLSEARKKGQVPKSQDLSSAISFGLFALALTALATYVLQRSYVFMQESLRFGSDPMRVIHELPAIGMRAIIWFLILAAPFLAIAFFTGVVGNMVQVGFLFTKDPLKPSFSKMNPISGFKNIMGKKAAFGLVKNLMKLFIVVGFTVYTLYESAVVILNAGRVGTFAIFPLMIDLVSKLAFNLAIFMAILGIADYVYQRYDHKKNLMMSMQEIKDEYKEMEGDPQIKSQRKAMYRDMVSGNMSDVGEATVLITNPTHFAIAIRYDKDKDQVPVVLVKGQDLMALKMRELAKEQNVPIIENKPLARALYKQVEPNDPIPTELYQTIAEILALIFQAEQAKKYKI